MSQDSLSFVQEGLWRILSGLDVDSWLFAGLVFDGDRHTSAVSLIAHKLHQLLSVGKPKASSLLFGGNSLADIGYADCEEILVIDDKAKQILELRG